MNMYTVVTYAQLHMMPWGGYRYHCKHIRIYYISTKI